MDITIKRALPSECGALTEISFAAKQYWQYPREYYTIWREQLTITGRYISNNLVYCAVCDGVIAGYFAIVNVTEDFDSGRVHIHKGHWLEHIFIRPSFMYKGLGTQLMAYADQLCRERGIPCLYIFSDPYAKGFYDRLGADYIGESPSGIEGHTMLMYRYDIVPQTMEQQVD